MTTPTKTSINQSEFNKMIKDHKEWFKDFCKEKPLSIDNCILYDIIINDETFNNVTFQNTIFNNVFFNNVIWEYTRFINCELNASRFNECRFERCDFKKCDFSCCHMQKCKIESYFQSCRLGVNFTGSNIEQSDMFHCVFIETNFSQTTGLLKPKDFMNKNFEKDEKGWIVYKGFDCEFAPNPNWLIKPGSYIEETVNADRFNTCGCGINFATVRWIRDNYRDAQIWKCRVEFEDACGIVVPYKTNGKARCDRLQILELID